MKSKKADEFQALYEYLTEGHVAQLREYYKKLFAQYPDGLTTIQIAQMTGFHRNSVNKWIKNGHLKACRGNINLIPKTYVLDFLCSDFMDEARDIPEQAKLITAMENDGVAHVALISRGNDTLAEELLSVQEQVLMEIYHPEELQGDTPDETEQEPLESSLCYNPMT